MILEVERKFSVAELGPMAERLVKLGARIAEPHRERDVYYRHPGRDFGQTDEALRIRHVGERAFLTYKGPKLDATTKTRQEIEIPFDSPAAAEQLASLLEALGFSRVAEVNKLRRKATLSWQARSVEAALDDVQGLGTFVELETLADETQFDAARTCLASLAIELDLSADERRGYLSLLLEKTGG